MDNKNLVVTKVSKTQATLGSSNFWVSLISILFLVLRYNDPTIPEGIEEQVYEAFASKELFAIISIMIPNFLNPVIKIVKSKFDTGFVKSINFWVQVATVVLIGVSGLGIAFPDNAAVELFNSITGGDVTRIILALVINIINPLIHFFKKREGKEEVVIVDSARLGKSDVVLNLPLEEKRKISVLK